MSKQKPTRESIVEQVLARHQNKRGALIPILLEIEKIYGYIPPSIAEQIAEALRTTQAHLYAVASFYSHLRTRPRGHHLIRVCNGIACEVDGGADLLRAIEEELGIHAGETTSDGFFTLESVACIGVCAQAPAILIDKHPYGPLTPQQARKLIRRYREAEKE